ncbi:MAG: hypothetical protein ACRC0X_02255 [Brevinema sp.]
MDIIASIHDQWLEKIKSGQKIVELRKTKPKNIEFPCKIYWYNTKTKMIEGFSSLESIFHYDPKASQEDLSLLSTASCLSIQEIEKYRNDKEILYLWGVILFQSMIPTPLPKNKKAPQSWCYYRTIFGEE